jgi:hypothetical protein
MFRHLGRPHRNQTINRKGAYILADVLAMDNSNVGAATRLFLRIFSEVTYIRTVGNSTVLKIYTLPNHTITIGMCILETQLSSYYMAVALVSFRNGPCRGCLLIHI